MLDLGSPEMTMLWLSAALGIVYLLAAVLASVAGRGMPWALGPRDEGWPEIGKVGGRIERSWKNFMETFPIFAAAILVEASAGHGSALAAIGAQLYFWSRVAFLPIYSFGLPVVRTLVWTASLVGIVLILAACIPGL
jgi:uncharacterized MAPEG superfamily protein